MKKQFTFSAGPMSDGEAITGSFNEVSQPAGPFAIAHADTAHFDTAHFDTAGTTRRAFVGQRQFFRTCCRQSDGICRRTVAG